MSVDKSSLTVIQSTLEWLPQTQAWIYHQIRSLPREISCHIVCRRTTNLDQFSLPTIHSLEQRSVWERFVDGALKQAHIRHFLGILPDIAQQHDASVLHSHFGNRAWADIGAARRASLVHVATFYGFDVGMLPKWRPVWRRRYRELFRSVDFVLCEGPHMLARVAELGCPADKLLVHHLGVPLDQLVFRPRSWKPTEPLRVLMAASFQEKKGTTYGLRALARLKRDLPIEVTLIGDANYESRSQEEKRRILAVIADEGLTGNVRMLGFQPYAVLVREALEHHVFLAPSVTGTDGDTEGGAPVSLIEMAATGMPVVSSWHCDIPEVIKDGVTGLLAPEGDVDALYLALRRLVESPESWGAMVGGARRHVELEFDARRQGMRLAEIYRAAAA